VAEYLFGRDDHTGAPVDAARRPAATAMNCDDADGRALDKSGDMIGEGDKGLTGSAMTKTSVTMLCPHIACPLSPLLLAGWLGREKGAPALGEKFRYRRSTTSSRSLFSSRLAAGADFRSLPPFA
jgi:hypothetical protein